MLDRYDRTLTWVESGYLFSLLFKGWDISIQRIRETNCVIKWISG